MILLYYYILDFNTILLRRYFQFICFFPGTYREGGIGEPPRIMEECIEVMEEGIITTPVFLKRSFAFIEAISIFLIQLKSSLDLSSP